MAALTGPRDDRRKGPTHAFGLVSYLVAAGVIIYKGAGVVVGADGYLRPARGNTADTAVGVAFESFDNSTGAAGAANALGQAGCRVWKAGNFVFPKAAAVITDLSKPVYLADDGSVQTTAIAGQLLGSVVAIHDANNVRVLIDGKVA